MTRQPGHLNGSNNKNYQGPTENGAQSQRASVFPIINILGNLLWVPGRTRTFLPKFQEISKRFKLLNIKSLSQNQTCRHIS